MRLSRVAALALVACQSVLADPLRADHPLIGTWKITVPGGTCNEIHRVRKDGTSLVTSADEVAEAQITISDQPSASGFYKWVDKIIKDNGKKDCSGEVMQIGHETTTYILLHPSGKRFLMCEREDRSTCIGPFVRIDDSL